MTATTFKRLGMGSAALALAVTATATAAAAGTSRHADSSTNPDQFTIAIGGNPDHPTAIVNGAISGSGKDDPNHGQYDVLHLNGGTIRVTHPNKDSSFVPTIDRKTCYVSFLEHGKFTLDHGTGQYAGKTGSGTYHATGFSISKRKSSGKCDLHSKPKVEIFDVIAKGKVG